MIRETRRQNRRDEAPGEIPHPRRMDATHTTESRGPMPVTPTIRILVSDDHPVVLAGIKDMLSAEPSFEVIGEARDGEEAVEQARRLGPDVVLMDLQMPKMDGVAATSRIREVRPGTSVLILTTYESDADVLRAIEAGAGGYLLKDAPKEELFWAIRAVSGGQSHLSPAVAARLTRRMQGAGVDALTAREIEVLELVAQGVSNKEIAKRLWISETTVKGHLFRTFEKLQARDRTSAVTEALKRGIIRLES